MFLGFVGYYRRFINNFSAIAQPLNALLRKTVEWTWGTEQQDAFEALREALISAPILEMPDFTKKFTVRTDASYSGLGACLLQGEGDDRKPIAYASRSLKPAETRYTATEIECLGMKWAVKTFRPYIHGRRFIMETDHIALKWLRTVQHTNGRLIRTAMEMQQYEMDIVHRAGIKMYDADALSRLRTTREGRCGPQVGVMTRRTGVLVIGKEGPRAPLNRSDTRVFTGHPSFHTGPGLGHANLDARSPCCRYCVRCDAATHSPICTCGRLHQYCVLWQSGVRGAAAAIEIPRRRLDAKGCTRDALVRDGVPRAARPFFVRPSLVHTHRRG